jgi:glycosyltransferase involved in cell wall biosynthesis
MTPPEVGITPPEASVTVCITAGAAGTLLTLTLNSVKTHTPADVPVVVLGSESLTNRRETASPPADVVLLEPGCVVAAGWLDGLMSAAASGGAVATVSALTQQDVNVQPGPSFYNDAAAARSHSLRLRPRLPAAHGPCVFVRRSALELIGQSDASGLPRAEISRRCTEAGLFHVLADDVLVLDQRSAPEPSIGAGTDGGPAARAAGRIRRAITGLSVVIDARILSGPTTGTHVHVLEVVAGLARTRKLRLTVILPDDPSEHAAGRLKSLDAISVVTYRDVERADYADVVHRPFQVSNAGDLTFLRTLGERLILTQQDLIGYHNPSYFPDPGAWQEYRRLTALALAAADRVAFLSATARDDAVAEDLIDPARAVVVRLGVDHPVAPADQSPSAPAGAQRLVQGAEAILCLGTDFHHKNRVFALRILERLEACHDWEGVLMFAGPAVGHGSSREQESQWLAARPQLAPAVLDVGTVSEAEKAWLFGRAALVVYPSVVEGFGLVPFEAAAHGVPCVWAPGTSLRELLPDNAAEIVPWDEGRSAERALALMRDEAARQRNVAAIRSAAQSLTWDATAAELLELYEATADAPARTSNALDIPGARTQGVLGEDAMRLVGPGGELPPDVHRPLLALATHPRIAAPVFGALKLGYRASYRLRRELHKRT